MQEIEESQSKKDKKKKKHKKEKKSKSERREKEDSPNDGKKYTVSREVGGVWVAYKCIKSDLINISYFLDLWRNLP